MDTFVPWAMTDKQGNFIGFEIDVARRLADDMGVKVEFVPTAWSGIIPALLTGKFDVIIGGMGIRPKRALKVNFTIPYDYSGMSMVAHKEKAAGFNSLDDFKSFNNSVFQRSPNQLFKFLNRFFFGHFWMPILEHFEKTGGVFHNLPGILLFR